MLKILLSSPPLSQHGRVKLKSTAQQEEEKRKEREKKLKVYVATRDACFSKASNPLTRPERGGGEADGRKIAREEGGVT